MNGVKARKVLSFILLPQIIPRARVLFASGFGYIAFLMANIYGAVRLLPRTHPYLNPANIGRFGIRHVIGEAANNLVLKKENADQIAVFAALLFGIGILLMQIALIIYAFAIRPALAGAGTSFFLTPDPAGANTTDIAFIVLDQVFGIPQLFCTIGNRCTTINAGLPWPYHAAFHELLRFYSYGMLIIGVIIFLYYVVVVVGETATTGSPFGQRFQNAWVPIRLVVALGLLIPINFGLNTGQYVVLYAAKYGSGFATNAWRQFNNTLQSRTDVFNKGPSFNPSGERQSLLAKPMPPDIMPVVQMMSIVHACAYAYWKLDPNTAARPATATTPSYPGMPRPPDNNFYIRPYFVKLEQPWMTNSAVNQPVTNATTYVNALAFYNDSDIIIRFGRLDPSNSTFDREKGQVMPYCGDVRIPITYLRTRGQGGTFGGPDMMQEYYFNLIRSMWFDPGLIRSLPQRYMEHALQRKPSDECNIGCGYPSLPACNGTPPNCGAMPLPTAEARQTLINEYNTAIRGQVDIAWRRYNENNTDIRMTAAIIERGWAGGGNLVQHHCRDQRRVHHVYRFHAFVRNLSAGHGKGP